MMCRVMVSVVLLHLSLSAHAADPKRDALWAAVRSGNAPAIDAAIRDGADVNAKNEYGVSALWIASGTARLEIVEQLVKHGADVNVRDDIWYQTPLSSAVAGLRLPTVKFLIASGAKDTNTAFLTAAQAGNTAMMKAILDSKPISQDALDASLEILASTRNEDATKLVVKAGAKPIPAMAEAERVALQKLVGTYESDGGQKIELGVKEIGLVSGGRFFRQVKPGVFVPLGSEGQTLTVVEKDGAVQKLVVQRFTAESSFYRFRVPPAKPVAPVISTAATAPPIPWPSFRGPQGTGIADGQNPPITWDVAKGEGVQWKTAIPGLGHSCPVIWGDRIFLTTAISSGQKDQKIRIGNYGDVGSVNDTSSHQFQVLCLDRASGAILWTRTAHEGPPKIKRHLKGSQANCTPATDGTCVVACFGSEGLYCYEFDGRLRWKRDLSTLDSSFSLDREYEWGFGNSPILHEGLCILQGDLSRDSFLTAFLLQDGSKVWSTPRDEIPSWSSPVIWKNSVRTEIVTNAAQYARGYDPRTGAELWRIAKKSELTVPSPVLGPDLAFVCSGNRPIQPIIAIKPGAQGDISLKPNETKNSHIAWSTLRGGPYMPTPILYHDLFYTCSNSGVLACYEARTGKEVYKERIGGTSYTASPIASDGRIYLASEQGEIRVVKAGRDFELLAINPIDDYVMATPAMASGSLIVRSQHFLWSLGKK